MGRGSNNATNTNFQARKVIADIANAKLRIIHARWAAKSNCAALRTAKIVKMNHKIPKMEKATWEGSPPLA